VAGYKLSGLTDIKPGVQNSRGRLKQVVLVASKGGLSLSGDQFRKAIGYGVIKSTRFSVKINKGEASFSGNGNGHGVGLCQWGAKQRALDGFGYREILSYYYPGTELKKFSDIR
jgi:stage II sporulation protein D